MNNNQIIQNNQDIQPVPVKTHIDRIIDYYYRDDPDGILMSHSKLAELITLIYIAYNGHENMRGLLVKINEKSGRGYLDVAIDNYMDMVNNGQIELHMAVKELFTVQDLNDYGL